MKVLEERLVYLFTLFCKDLLCSWFHFGSRTFICMCNIFVFPPPLTCCVFFWGQWLCDLFLFSPLIRCECISKCMLDSIWMTKPSSGFVLVFSAICSQIQISLFSCIISFHWPSCSIFAVLGHLSKLEMICINCLAMFVHLQYKVQWSYHFELSGMFVIPSLVCLLRVVLLLLWLFLSVVDFTSTSYGFHGAKS